MYGGTFKIGFSFFGGLYIHDIPRYGIRHKDNPAIGSLSHGLSFGTGVDDLDILEDLSSVVISHAAKINMFGGLWFIGLVFFC
jgi:hypothetical protein